MCDQLRWDAVGFSGDSSVETPVLDSLAESGAVFEHAYCSSPVCSPARASWFTGLYPHAHHQYKNYGPGKKGIFGCYLPEEKQTIGDVLKREGYTCGNVGVWHLGDDENPQHGFDDYWRTYRYLDRSVPDPFFSYIDKLGITNPYDPSVTAHFQEGFLPYANLTDPRQQRTTWTVDQSLEFLETRKNDPFFLLAGIKDPHPVMIPPPELLERYPPEGFALPDNFRDPLEGKPAYQKKVRFRMTEDTMSEEDFRLIMQYYYALIAHIDREIGRIINYLEQNGLRENTIIVFNSDHGEFLGNHGFVEKCLMYEESVRVPCIVSWPAQIPAGSRINTPLGGVDLMPTIIGLAGCAFPDTIDGRSIADSLCSGNEPGEMPVFAEIADQAAIYGGSENRRHFAGHIMVQFRGWKYVQNRDDTNELYNLVLDPGEMANLAGATEWQDKSAEMRNLIKDMLAKTGPGLYHWCLQ